MSYKIEEKENSRVVHLTGEIDMDVADKARQTILPLIEAGHEVHLNLSNVQYMDSSGISVLIESHQKALEMNNKLIVKDKIKMTKQIIRFMKIINYEN